MAGERRYDVAVIGGGIVGMATAMALTQRGGVSLVVLEAEDRLAPHQTGNNSGVIHSGLYYKPGSQKARTCVEGRQALYRFCAEHGIAHERCGKLVVATTPAELPRLDELARRGGANGLEGLRRIGPQELRDVEPHVAGLAGLLVPQTGIVDYVAVTKAYAEEVRRAGGEVVLKARLRRVRREAGGLTLDTTAGSFRARHLVNCAGLQCDRVARLCGARPGVRIVPFRGEYYELAPARRHLVRNLIYPVPDPQFPFLGVHFTRKVGGGVEAGPNAVLAFKREGYRKTSFSLADSLATVTFPGFWRLATRYWRMGSGEMWRSWNTAAFVRALQRLLPEVERPDLAPGGAGVRAQALDRSGALVDDFSIIEQDGMVHVLNAPSPAATASLAIGRHIAGMAARQLGLRT
jgi:(S)-2-hydroxyglutarate dehydrogenase